MHFWIYLFVAPIAFLTAILIYLLLRERSALRSISAWPALLAGFAAPIFALWGLLHRNAIQMPLAFEYGFERRVWLASIVAALFALAWLIQSRRRYAAFVFVISFLTAAFWSAVVLPLK